MITVPRLAALAVADAPAVWGRLGFALTGDTAWVGGVAIRLGATGKGVTGWSFRTAGGDDGRGWADLRSAGPVDDEPAPPPEHPVGVTALDHVVVRTPDLSGTVADLEAHGLVLRRTRDPGPGSPFLQAFFVAGPAVVEVVGPREAGQGSPAFYGLAFTVADIDATVAFLGSGLGAVTDAVQPGRRIATLQPSAGSTVPVAFLSPRG